VVTAGFDDPGRVVFIKEANGNISKSADLKGDKGDKGDSVTLSIGYDPTCLYKSHVNEVKEGGQVWRALKDGLLHKPGSKKSKQSEQWVLIAHAGAPGPAGKDADEAAIQERIESGLVMGIKDIIDETIEMVDLAFSDIDFNV